MAYRKNFAPKSRAEVAGGNDHCCISEPQKRQSREEKKNYDEGYLRIFRHD